jgi:hypothetical protein
MEFHRLRLEYHCSGMELLPRKVWSMALDTGLLEPYLDKYPIGLSMLSDYTNMSHLS